MNRYQEISDKVGFYHEKINLPTISEALTLYRAVAYDESGEAFEKVLEYYRFTNTGTTEQEFDSGRIIVDAYEEGKKIFSNEPAVWLNEFLSAY